MAKIRRRSSIRSRDGRAELWRCGATETEPSLVASTTGWACKKSGVLPTRKVHRRDRLRGWPYRTRTSMCREKIHLFDMSRKFGFRGPPETAAVPRENDLLCYGWTVSSPQSPSRPHCERRTERSACITSKFLNPAFATGTGRGAATAGSRSPDASRRVCGPKSLLGL